MKKISELDTPSVIVKLDVLESNIKEMANMAKKNDIKLFPMEKTHKSKEIAKMQLEQGAEGFLVAKLDEAEIMIETGAKNIILAYPIIGTNKMEKLFKLKEKANIICSIDTYKSAELLSLAAVKSGVEIDCIIIIDSGLHRLGIPADKILDFYRQISDLSNISVIGVATHGGHVYGAKNQEEILRKSNEEISNVVKAKEILESEGIKCKIVALGSTPTVNTLTDFTGITHIRPGNYVFNDAIQVSMGIVPIEKCSLSVITTVISTPEPGRAIIDAGSKVFCLDSGAHGNNLIKGFGIVKQNSKIILSHLSEEVGILEYPIDIKIEVGDRLEIIPNHACVVVNMVDEIIGVKNSEVIKTIKIDARGKAQ